MSFLWARLKAIANLGLIEVVTVIFYRLMIKLSIHPACLIKGDNPNGPFFSKSRLPTLRIPPVSSWDDCGLLFSYIDIPLGESPPDWLTNPITGDKIESGLLPWWKISDFDEQTGDIKLIWEQSRMDWVVAFAQRARNGDQKALIRLNTWLTHWLENNPAYLGANWKCGQEASIRVIHLCCAALILGQDRQPLPGLQQLIRLHLRRISPTKHYAIAQNNNHGTSEAAALFIGGSCLASIGSIDGKRWEKQGRGWLENRTKKLIGRDGSFSQYSLNYHRMLLDTLSIAEVWRQRSEAFPFSLNFYSKAEMATSWLFQMVAHSSGDGPNLGANDGSRLLQLTDSTYRDYRPSIQLGMALFQDRHAYAGKGLWDLQLAWLGVPDAKGEASSYSDCDYDDGGYKILRSGKTTLVLRYPRFRYRPSQADALHIDLWVGGTNLLRDAGSYSYNSKSDLSEYFSGTIAHNTVQFDDRDQMPKLSRFLYGHWLKTTQVTPISRNKGGVNCSAGYSDFMNAEHLRKVHLNANSLSVIDEIKGFKKKAVLRWRLPNDCWSIKTTSEGVVASDGDNSLVVTSNVPILSARLAEGWTSLFYMSKEAASVLEVEVGVAGKVTTEYRWSA
jgi:hypothetical protein